MTPLQLSTKEQLMSLLEVPRCLHLIEISFPGQMDSFKMELNGIIDALLAVLFHFSFALLSSKTSTYI